MHEAGARWARRSFSGASEAVARRLLGHRFVHVLEDGARVAGLIVEVEAYVGVEDRAAHSFGGRRTARNESMYAHPGTLYVYFTYGMHHCMNVVCGAAGEPVAVLVRALEPVEGLDRMRACRSGSLRRRPSEIRDRELCSGPGKVCQALGVDRSLDGLDLASSGQVFIERARRRPVPSGQIGVGPRIGIGNAGSPWTEAPLRFWIEGNPHVSR